MFQHYYMSDKVENSSVSSAAVQSGNYKIDDISETKLLDNNMKKSGFIVMGGAKESLEIERQLEVSPLTLQKT